MSEFSATPLFDTQPEMTMRDYWHVVMRRKWLVVLALVATVGSSLALVLMQKPIYEAESQMLVRSLSSESVFNTQTVNNNNAARFIDTEIRVLEGQPVEDRVGVNLGIEGDIPNVNGSPVGQTDVISVKVRSGDARTAAILADAYVQAYTDVRREQNVQGLLDAAAEVQKKISELQTQINAIDEQVAAAPSDQQESLRAALAPQRQLLVDQQAVFKQRLDQIQVDASVQSGSAQLVRPAITPTSPAEPNPMRTLALAIIVGLLLGLGAAFLADYLDVSVNSAEDLERASGGLPVLGAVPQDNPPDNRPIAISQPKDLAVEAYRGLRTSVQFITMDRAIKVVQVTSALPGEGKTTTAANLAVLLVQAGKRVVLVDADLRKPRIHEVFVVDGGKGLTTALLGSEPEVVMQKVEVGDDRLTLITSGPIPTNPSELVGSNRMRSLLSALRDEFDIIIVDAPPVLPVTDAVVLAGLTDIVIVVAKAHQTTDAQVRETVSTLARAGATLGGTVLNKVDLKKSRYGYGYGYGRRYGAGRYGYGGYGHDDAAPKPRRPEKVA